MPARIVSAIALCASLVTSVSLADQPKPSPSHRVALDLSDGSLVLGTVKIKSIPIQTPYAQLDLNQA